MVRRDRKALLELQDHKVLQVQKDQHRRSPAQQVLKVRKVSKAILALRDRLVQRVLIQPSRGLRAHKVQLEPKASKV